MALLIRKYNNTSLTNLCINIRQIISNIIIELHFRDGTRTKLKLNFYLFIGINRNFLIKTYKLL